MSSATTRLLDNTLCYEGVMQSPVFFKGSMRISQNANYALAKPGKSKLCSVSSVSPPLYP
ncbi:hypothetical protein NECAME_13953 [Necator americanus]|uniref:Uncharacterized protein n=1 Tax=Necator americanus TaxID=51031 RepID=W2SRB3_NECAM|nr:hypothetical protein NECAME_13953 [Necator americanus]ETN72175.1 hypothetical protein NECAME_13953 [Necator americanus]